MDNTQHEQDQQSPLAPGPAAPPDYTAWQYDPQAQPMQTPYPAQDPDRTQLKRLKPLPPRYQDPIADMGTTLGYGQSMEYQYLDAPQPSQPMAQIRMERLQQLRQERALREQQQHPDITTLIRKRTGSKPLPPLQSLQAPPHPSGTAYAPHQRQSGQLSGEGVARGPSSLLPLPPAAPVSTQDTGMIKKQRRGRATVILTGAFFASRVLGLLRTIMFSHIFGASQLSDAYIQAALVPDTIFAIVSGGALSSAFIPVFTKYMSGDGDEDAAWHVANTALTLATTVMVILALIAAIFAQPIAQLYNPGASPEKIALTVNLMRIMFIQCIVLGSGVIINAVLNAQQDFTLPAIGIALYNIGPILGLLPGLVLMATHHPNEELALYCAAGGIVLAAVLQVGVQIPGLTKIGMHFRPSFDWRHPGILQIGKQMIPRIINSSMFSFSTFVDRFLIGLMSIALIAGQTLDGLNTEYYQAFQLVLLPLGIFGMAITTAAFPNMAEYVSKGRMDRARDVILETLRSALFLSIPSSLALIVLGLPIIQAILQHGEYTLTEAEFTAVPLACFAIGLAGQAAVEVLTRSFYAMRDSRTPVIISVLQFIFKIALGILLISPFVAAGGVQWGMGALALSTSIATMLETLLLFWVLHDRIGELLQRSFFTFLGRALLATLGMGIGTFVVRLILDFLLNTSDTSRPIHEGGVGTLLAVVKVAIEITIGIFIYLRLARALGIEELGPLKRLLDRFKLSWVI